MCQNVEEKLVHWLYCMYTCNHHSLNFQEFISYILIIALAQTNPHYKWKA